MNIKNLTPVLFVKDALISASFYQDIMGFTVVMNNGDQNFLFKEGLAVWQIDDDNIISRTHGVEPLIDSKAIGRFEICFETEELDSVYEKLKEAKVTFLHEINTEIWGQRTIRFYDPDGHLIEIGEAMAVFLKRILDEENGDFAATSRRTFTSEEVIKQLLGIS